MKLEFVPGNRVCIAILLCFGAIQGSCGCLTAGPKYFLLETGSLVATDREDNIYVSGVFAGTADFDPGAGIDMHTATSQSDIFLSKFDADGNFVWARTWGGTNETPEARALMLDNAGDIYIVGEFSGHVDFNPGEEVEELSSTVGNGPYVSKFNPDGDWLWTRNWGPGSLMGAAIDGDGIVSVAGWQGQYQNDLVDFDPGPGESKLHCDSGCPYISEFDSDGYFLSVLRIPDQNQPTRVFFDNEDNMYTAGFFGNWAGIYLTKYGSNWNSLWTNEWADSSFSTGALIAWDQDKNILFGGVFDGTVDLNPSPADEFLTPDGSGDIFLCRFDSAGNYLWGLTWGGSTIEFTRSLVSDDSGNGYILGIFFGLVDFDPGPSTNEIQSNGDQDVFLSKIGAAGNYEWTITWGGPGIDDGRGMTIDNEGNLLVTGMFSGEVDFDPTYVVELCTARGPHDIYTCKFDPNGNLVWVRTWGSPENVRWRDPDPL